MFVEHLVIKCATILNASKCLLCSADAATEIMYDLGDTQTVEVLRGMLDDDMCPS